MKKGINKKALILPLFILTILVINLVMVSAGPKIDWVKEKANTYLIPNAADISEFAGELEDPSIITVISIIGFIIFCLIIFEIANLLPLSTLTNSAIALGSIIILVLIKWVRTVITWIMASLATVIGLTGMFGMIMIGVIFVILGIALFTGATWAHKYINKIRFNKEMASKTKKAYKAAANVSALNTEAASVDYK